MEKTVKYFSKIENNEKKVQNRLKNVQKSNYILMIEQVVILQGKSHTFWK